SLQKKLVKLKKQLQSGKNKVCDIEAVNKLYLKTQKETLEKIEQFEVAAKLIIEGDISNYNNKISVLFCEIEVNNLLLSMR
ncbi:MAG: hypothetical protein LC437_09620, partial [Thiohalomonas sp.]|nr:hypothetical protein [Thiohalomonas sp.]